MLAVIIAFTSVTFSSTRAITPEYNAPAPYAPTKHPPGWNQFSSMDHAALTPSGNTYLMFPRTPKRLKRELSRSGIDELGFGERRRTINDK